MAPIGMREYDVGDVVRTTAKYRVSGVLTDPTILSFKFKTPAGVTTTKVYGVDLDVVKDSVGVYHYDVSLATSGVWAYRWVSTGTAAGAVERKMLVKTSEF